MSEVHEKYLLLFSMATVLSSLFSSIYIEDCLLLLTWFQLALTYFQYGFRIIFFPLVIGLIVLFLFNVLELIGLEPVPPPVYWGFFCITLGVSLAGYLAFGKCDFGFLRKAEMGPYAVGYKEFRSASYKNMVSVFYPITKEEYNNKVHTRANVTWLRHGEKSLEGISRASADYGEDNHMSTWWFKFLLQVKMDVIQDGEIHPDLTSSSLIDNESQSSLRSYSHKLIPIIFSHGAVSNRTMHSAICKYLASQGHMVFALDHNDQSSYHTILPCGQDSFHFNKRGELNLSYRKRQISLRQRELIGLVDDLQDQSTLLGKVLGFPSELQIDLDKLTVVGHSMGGSTALLAANVDPRIKAIYLHDGWLFMYQTLIQEEQNLKVDIPMGSISTSMFHEYVIDDQYFSSPDEMNQKKYNTWDSTVKLFNISQKQNPESSLQENIRINGMSHVEQSDMALLMPFEIRFLGSGQFPYRDIREKYLLHARLVHRFLANIGFASNRNWNDETIIQNFESRNVLMFERRIC